MTSRHTGTARQGRMGPLPIFPGADRVYRLIGALYLRSPFGDRPRNMVATETDIRWEGPVSRDERSGRKGLPMVCLVRPGGPDDLIQALDRLLSEAKRAGVRHACVTRFAGLEPDDAGEDEDDDEDEDDWSDADVTVIRELLRQARNPLVNYPRVRGRRLRFGLFSLVYSLMDTTPDPDDPNPDGTVRRHLQSTGLTPRIKAAIRAVDQEVSGSKLRWKLPLWAVYLLTLGIFRLALTGRVPVLSGKYRWFLHQPHLAPEMSGTFVRFAGRLISWPDEAPEYVARLLVNSFLEDLRRAYRLRPWQIGRARRMTYPVLLLDTATVAHGGDRLLRLINDVRNQTGLFDPLLVISASGTDPASTGRAEDSLPLQMAQHAVPAYLAWQNHLLENRRARRDITWYLPIGIPASADTDMAGSLAFNGFDPGRAARPPLASSRWLRLGVVVVLLAGAVTGAGVTYHRQCDSWQSSLTRSGSQCVGFTAGWHDLFHPSDAAIQTVENTISSQNEQAEQLHAMMPARPYITLADLEALTSSDGTAEGLTAERESLEGVAVAQKRQLAKTGNADPIVRVLIANGGDGMRQGSSVAAELGAKVRRYPPLVGVIGLDMSSQPTLTTIQALTAAGLPMVAATLSQDSLASVSPMYFQVAPQNSTEAAVVAAFARHLALTSPSVPRTVRIYYSDDATDTYSTNLRTDAAAAFRQLNFHVTTKAFVPSGSPVSLSEHALLGDPLVGDADAAGRDTCPYRGFVFFAGRGVPDYGDFLAGASQCNSQGVFIGDDDVSRYVADAAERHSNLAVPFYYVSFAPAPATATLKGPARDFYTTLDSLFPFENDPVQDRSLDGHAALSYDAATVLITAVSYLEQGANPIPVTPGSVWREITAITGAQNRIDGVSGTIDYGGDISRQVPSDKPVAILQVADGVVNPDAATFCGAANGPATSAWCPSRR